MRDALAAASSSTCSSTSTRTRTARSSSCCACSCGEHRNVCVVGDDDQSIYAWRGADVRNILDFEEHFPGAKVVKLEQNYRSRAPILDVANAVIAKRTDAKWRKVLFTDASAAARRCSVAVAPTPEVEATLRRRARSGGSSATRAKRRSDVAVLYRSNGQSKLVEEALREQGVPHRMVGGQQFFERKEVKDVLAYLKLALNPSDEISLRRDHQLPARAASARRRVEKLALHATRARLVALAGGRAGRRARRRARARRATAASALERRRRATRGGSSSARARRRARWRARSCERVGLQGGHRRRARRRSTPAAQALGQRRGPARRRSRGARRATGAGDRRARRRSSTR